MDDEQQAGAVELDARRRGVSPPVTRRIWIGEQASLAELHAVLQVAFGWSDEHLYAFQIRGWQFGDPSRAIELALAGGGVDIALTAFGFEIGEPFLYQQYNLFVPWEIDCRRRVGKWPLQSNHISTPNVSDWPASHSNFHCVSRIYGTSMAYG